MMTVGIMTKLESCRCEKCRSRFETVMEVPVINWGYLIEYKEFGFYVCPKCGHENNTGRIWVKLRSL